ncbi:MAG: toxin [Desulfobacterales bacterium S5133MH16]|nr:MAG: toxin [Desulfobacterales bacterium S5133MH16]
MHFEFDPIKSKNNKKKHGIDFIEAQALWDDPDLLEIPARTTDEQRFLVIGKIEAKHWSGVITYRSENIIRIISVRRARDEEMELYES